VKTARAIAACHGRPVYHLVVLADPRSRRGDINSLDMTLCGMILVTRGGRAEHDTYPMGTPVPKVTRMKPLGRRLCKACKRARARARAKKASHG
jgi:hypothetical protein